MEQRKNIFGELEYKLKQKDLVEYIAKNPNQTESQIQLGLWNYDRTTSKGSNKKYADILRRAMKARKVTRTFTNARWRYTVK